MKGTSLLILLLTIVALLLLAGELIHSFSGGSLKKKEPPIAVKKTVAPAMEPGMAVKWRHYTLLKKVAGDSFYYRVISDYPQRDTLFPSDILKEKQMKVYMDTFTGSRICVFRPTSPDGRFGEWVILADSSPIYTRLSAVTIDTILGITGNRKVFVFRKEKTGVVFKDTLAPASNISK